MPGPMRLKPPDEEDYNARLERLFLFSVVWSIGATCDFDSRPKFSAALRGRSPMKFRTANRPPGSVSRASARGWLHSRKCWRIARTSERRHAI